MTEQNQELSEREFQIYRMLGEGKSGAQISKLLNLSGKSVATYKLRVKQKLELKTVYEIVIHALRTRAVIVPGVNDGVNPQEDTANAS